MTSKELLHDLYINSDFVTLQPGSDNNECSNKWQFQNQSYEPTDPLPSMPSHYDPASLNDELEQK